MKLFVLILSIVCLVIDPIYARLKPLRPLRPLHRPHVVKLHPLSAKPGYEWIEGTTNESGRWVPGHWMKTI